MKIRRIEFMLNNIQVVKGGILRPELSRKTFDRQCTYGTLVCRQKSNCSCCHASGFNLHPLLSSQVLIIWPGSHYGSIINIIRRMYYSSRSSRLQRSPRIILARVNYFLILLNVHQVLINTERTQHMIRTANTWIAHSQYFCFMRQQMPHMFWPGTTSLFSTLYSL